MKLNHKFALLLAGAVLAGSLGCGASSAPASSAASSEAAASSAVSEAASASAEAALPDGAYTADFDTDSSMFHANEALDEKGTLTVKDGQMTFHVSLVSKKIVNLYVGTAEDAASHEADWLQPTTDTVTYSDGTSDEVYGFDIPVEALDEDFQLAILGKKGKWYDHTVSVRNAQPAAAEAPADGTYTCDVTLEGGSGRATVDSPCGPDRGRRQDDRHHRLVQPQLRLYAGGRRKVSAHQHRGQLYLRDPRRGSRHPAGCGGRYRRHEHPA